MGPWDTGGFYGIESPAMKKLTLLPALLGLFLSVQSQAANIERVRVTTNLGEFVIEMQRDRAPLTVENFLGYVRADGYRNTLFHRAIANFVIQGGGVTTEYKAAPTQKQISNEAGNGLKNLRGTVGLARASGPHSGDRQFYVNVADNADLDPLPTRWGYAVFGRVVEGMEVVDRISVSPTGAMGPFKQEAPMQAVDHPEDRAVDRWRDACGQGSSRGRTDGNTAGRAGCGARNATGNTSGHAASETAR